MIDATKAPTPIWQRYAVAGLLTILLLVVGFVLYTKDFHHGATAGQSAPPAAGVASPPGPSITARTTPSTTIPGGIPLSGRNPFGN